MTGENREASIEGSDTKGDEGTLNPQPEQNRKPTKTERMQAKKKRASSDKSQYGNEAEHTSNRNKLEKHEIGQSRKLRDKGGEKADSRRYRIQDSKKR